jgi:hypothetical protein
MSERDFQGFQAVSAALRVPGRGAARMKKHTEWNIEATNSVT